MSQSVGVDTNRTVNPRIRLNSADSIISEDAIANKDSNPENRFDDLADQIINTFIVKKQERLIDREEHKENISYEESEIRLIYLGIFSASLLGMVLLVLTILFSLQALSTTQVIILNVTKPKEFFKTLVPKVLIMNKFGQGQMATVEYFDKNQSFELAWEFKLPRIPLDTGYYLFEDRGNIYSISSSPKMKITMLNELKHQIIDKSQIPDVSDKFYFSGNNLQVGHFVMIFGGSFRLLEGGNGWVNTGDLDWPCSSDRRNKTEPITNTVIWSIKRHVWFKGPFIPTPNHCIEQSSGFAVNRSHGVLLIVSKIESCIQAYTISFSTFQWVSINECLIDLEKDHTDWDRSIVSTTFMNSKQTNNLTVVILYNISMDDKQMLFLLDYYTGKVTPLGPLESYETFKLGWSGSLPISLFTLRNMVYLVWMQQSPLNNIKLFEFSSNNTFVYRQTIQDLNMTKLLGITDKVYKIITVPYY